MINSISEFGVRSSYGITLCYNHISGGVTEWPKVAVLKTAVPFRDRGFESLLLRQILGLAGALIEARLLLSAVQIQKASFLPLTGWKQKPNGAASPRRRRRDSNFEWGFGTEWTRCGWPTPTGSGYESLPL